MAELGPAAFILVAFIGAIGALVGVYGATGLAAPPAATPRPSPSLG